MTEFVGIRMELFVRDLPRSIAFYREVLGFEVLREVPDEYASIGSGSVILGLGPISKLSPDEGYFRSGIGAKERGLGVEIVLETDDLDALYRRVESSGYEISEPMQERPWGLKDFRIVDPDGYYLRITST